MSASGPLVIWDDFVSEPPTPEQLRLIRAWYEEALASGRLVVGSGWGLPDRYMRQREER